MAPVKAPKIDTPLPNALDDAARRLLVTFLDNAPRTPFNLGVLLALSTGMREGEICGLWWSDVSFRTNTLWVRRSIARDNGSYYVKQPKTRGSIRDIPLTSKAVEWLKDRKGAQEAELVVAGLSPTEERMVALYVLGGVDGTHMAPHTLSRAGSPSPTPWASWARKVGARPSAESAATPSRPCRPSGASMAYRVVVSDPANADLDAAVGYIAVTLEVPALPLPCSTSTRRSFASLPTIPDHSALTSL